MKYSLTCHGSYNRIYFYKLNKFILLAPNVILTGDIINKLELAIEQGLIK